MKEFIFILIIIFLCLFLYWLYRKNFKIIKTPTVCLITGGVKTGKSLLSVKLSIKEYKKRHRVWYFKTHFLGKDVEEPLYYTNVTISFRNIKSYVNKHIRLHRLDKNIVIIHKEHILRKYRFNYGSVIYIQESSLLSDNQDYKDDQRNVEQSLFNKLIGHETRGGALYYDTQSPLDNHYSIKRVSSTYFFIYKSINFFLFRVLYVREMINNDLGNNNFEDDVELTTRKVLVMRWWYKRYDRYEYSYLTDCLPLANDKVNYHGGLVSFNPLYVELADKRQSVHNERFSPAQSNGDSVVVTPFCSDSPLPVEENKESEGV